jgi:hypothetical protein
MKVEKPSIINGSESQWTPQSRERERSSPMSVPQPGAASARHPRSVDDTAAILLVNASEMLPTTSTPVSPFAYFLDHVHQPNGGEPYGCTHRRWRRCSRPSKATAGRSRSDLSLRSNRGGIACFRHAEKRGAFPQTHVERPALNSAST